MLMIVMTGLEIGVTTLKTSSTTYGITSWIWRSALNIDSRNFLYPSHLACRVSLNPQDLMFLERSLLVMMQKEIFYGLLIILEKSFPGVNGKAISLSIQRLEYPSITDSRLARVCESRPLLMNFGSYDFAIQYFQTVNCVLCSQQDKSFLLYSQFANCFVMLYFPAKTNLKKLC